MDGRSESFVFDGTSGLLTRQELELASRRGVLAVTYGDYKVVGGLQLPHRVEFTAPGAHVTYTTERVEHNVSIDDTLFAPPSR